jgi:Flp pilus assembly protein TadG
MARSRLRGAVGRGAKAVTAVVRRFGSSEHGNIGMMFGLAVIPFTLFVGAGVDIGRWLHARQETISAMDAAVLAGARALQLDSSNTSAAVTVAKSFYSENTKGRLALLDDSIAFSAADNNTTFRSNGNAHIETPFLALANVKSLPLLKSNGTEYSKAVLSAGGKSETSIEISVMLDVTGSMKGDKFTDMKTAATDLVNIVIPDSTSGNKVKIAVVPFAEGVRLPSSANAAARGNPANPLKVPYTYWNGNKNVTADYTYTPTGCVAERTGTNKYTDVAPGAGNYVLTVYDYTGDNAVACELTADDEVLPLTSNKTTLTNKIKNLDLSGTTAGQIGTAWAWYTLSPNWNALWSSSPAQAYSPGKLQKIAVLMTDGEYNTEYDAKGIKTGETGAGNAANSDSTTQARAVCAAMKKAGITVYAVGFDLGGNQTATTTLSGCATDSTKFYNTTTGDQLKQAFRDIALKINQLYLTH